MKVLYWSFLILLLGNCSTNNANQETEFGLVVLGIAQDAGFPQIDCQKECCRNLYERKSQKTHVISLGIYDHGKTYLFDASPDIKFQLNSLQKFSNRSSSVPDGIFLTHAHIGHYTGLMQFGKEAMSADSVPVYCMARMAQYLENNGPWSQLVANKNIAITPMQEGDKIVLSDHLSVTPLLVPHRDEYSETVGYKIDADTAAVLFIPDIDKWNKWEHDIVELIKTVDYAFLDGTFYSGQELGNRDMSQIPHPSVEESMATFDGLSKTDRSKIYFTHLNHTNPLLNSQSFQYKKVRALGYKVAEQGQVITF